MTTSSSNTRSKWKDPEHQAYWNALLKKEGLGTVKTRQVFHKRSCKCAKCRRTWKKTA